MVLDREVEVMVVSDSRRVISLTCLSSALRLWSEDELAELRQARAANAEVGVTGVPLYSGGKQRAFTEWSMGFSQVSADTAAQIPGFTDYLRTGQVTGAAPGRSAAATFHRVFRQQVRETPEWNRPGWAQDG